MLSAHNPTAVVVTDSLNLASSALDGAKVGVIALLNGLAGKANDTATELTQEVEDLVLEFVPNFARGAIKNLLAGPVQKLEDAEHALIATALGIALARINALL